MTIVRYVLLDYNQPINSRNENICFNPKTWFVLHAGTSCLVWALLCNLTWLPSKIEVLSQEVQRSWDGPPGIAGVSSGCPRAAMTQHQRTHYMFGVLRTSLPSYRRALIYEIDLWPETTMIKNKTMPTTLTQIWLRWRTAAACSYR